MNKDLNHFCQKIFFALIGGFIAAAGGIVVALFSDSRNNGVVSFTNMLAASGNNVYA